MNCEHEYEEFEVEQSGMHLLGAKISNRNKFRRCKKCNNLQRKGSLPGDEDKWFNSVGIAPPAVWNRKIIKETAK